MLHSPNGGLQTETNPVHLGEGAMLAMRSRIAGLLTSVLVAVVLGYFHSTLAWATELPCVPGHNTVVDEIEAGLSDFMRHHI